MTACGCNHRHLPGQTHCYACGLPINVPPADVASPVAAAEPASPPQAGTAGGTQAQEVRGG